MLPRSSKIAKMLPESPFVTSPFKSRGAGRVITLASVVPKVAAIAMLMAEATSAAVQVERMGTTTLGAAPFSPLTLPSPLDTGATGLAPPPRVTAKPERTATCPLAVAVMFTPPKSVMGLVFWLMVTVNPVSVTSDPLATAVTPRSWAEVRLRDGRGNVGHLAALSVVLKVTGTVFDGTTPVVVNTNVAVSPSLSLRMKVCPAATLPLEDRLGHQVLLGGDIDRRGDVGSQLRRGVGRLERDRDNAQHRHARGGELEGDGAVRRVGELEGLAVGDRAGGVQRLVETAVDNSRIGLVSCAKVAVGPKRVTTEPSAMAVRPSPEWVMAVAMSPATSSAVPVPVSVIGTVPAPPPPPNTKTTDLPLTVSENSSPSTSEVPANSAVVPTAAGPAC